MPDLPPRSDLLMPVPDTKAVQLMEIEVLRQISDTQNRTVEAVRDLRDEMKEDRKTLVDVRERVIRIESNRLDSQVKQIVEEVDIHAGRIDALERHRDRQEGAFGLANALRVWIPIFIGAVAIIIVVLAANGKI